MENQSQEIYYNIPLQKSTQAKKYCNKQSAAPSTQVFYAWCSNYIFLILLEGNKPSPIKIILGQFLKTYAEL